MSPTATFVLVTLGVMAMSFAIAGWRPRGPRWTPVYRTFRATVDHQRRLRRYRRVFVRGLEVEKVAQPESYCVEASLGDLSGDPGNPIAGEGARLLAHDPRRPIEATRPDNRNMVRPPPVHRRDWKNDHERCDGVEVARRGDHQDGSMAALLAASHRLERRPGDNARRKVKLAHAVMSASSVRSHSAASAA